MGEKEKREKGKDRGLALFLFFTALGLVSPASPKGSRRNAFKIY